MRILLLFVFLAGCGTVSQHQATAVTSDAILAMAVEVDRAHTRGWIDNNTEDRLINRLIQVQELLIAVYDVTDILGCTETMTKNECAEQVLAEVEKELRYE